MWQHEHCTILRDNSSYTCFEASGDVSNVKPGNVMADPETIGTTRQ